MQKIKSIFAIIFLATLTFSCTETSLEDEEQKHTQVDLSRGHRPGTPRR